LKVGYADKVGSNFTLKVNSGTTEGTDKYTYNGSTAKTLNIKPGSNVSFSTNSGELTINSSYVNTTYSLSGALSSNNDSYTVTLTPSSGSATTATISKMVGATTSTAGKAGLVPKPGTGDVNSFLKGDGSWGTPVNTWRPVSVNGTSVATSATGTGTLNLKSGTGISVSGTAVDDIIITNAGVRSVTIGTGDNSDKLAVNTNGNTTYLTVPYATLASTVTCTEGTSDNDRPIVLTNKTNGLYYTSKATINYSTGNLNTSGYISSAGFIKTGSSDSYVLLGGGGHKSISSFQTTYDSRYILKSGDTMTGPLTFANQTWNVVGDDAAIGDYNAAGMLGLKSVNNNIPGIGFHNSSNTLLGRL
jgi:hypothetical protein